MATNLLLLDDDQLSACRDLEIHLSTSLDGPAFLHNLNRPRPGRDSHARLEDAIGRARRYVGEARIAALMTTSRVSLNHPVEIVDEYVRLGFRSIFIRPISPYGFATRSPQKSTYPMDEFLGFYGAALARILEHNRAGTLLSEAYARLLLTKILTPFDSGYVDLQSPAGAGVAVAVYNYDGDVYASDEGRMLAEEGDRRFRLGKVGDGYSALFGGDTLRRIAAASVVESLPGCELCAFRPYCGADPVYHYATQGDLILHQPTSGFCRKNMGILRHLFTLLEAPDSDLERIFFSWLRGSVGERS
jgi:His-Xaa-Ser system radical SAM maturase HxsB